MADFIDGPRVEVQSASELLRDLGSCWDEQTSWGGRRVASGSQAANDTPHLFPMTKWVSTNRMIRMTRSAEFHLPVDHQNTGLSVALPSFEVAR